MVYDGSLNTKDATCGLEYTGAGSAAHLEVVGEIGARSNGALRDVAAAVVPFIASHGEAVPMNGNAVCCTWEVSRNVVEYVHLW